MSIDNKNPCTIANISANFIKWGKDFCAYIAIIPRRKTQLIRPELFGNSTRHTRSKWLLRSKNFHHIWVKGCTQDRSQKTSTFTVCIKLWMRTKQPAGFSVTIRTMKDVHTLPALHNFKSRAFICCNCKDVKNWNNISEIRVEEYCWDTGGRAVILWSIRFLGAAVWLPTVMPCTHIYIWPDIYSVLTCAKFYFQNVSVMQVGECLFFDWKYIYKWNMHIIFLDLRPSFVSHSILLVPCE